MFPSCWSVWAIGQFFWLLPEFIKTIRLTDEIKYPKRYTKCSVLIKLTNMLNMYFENLLRERAKSRKGILFDKLHGLNQ